MAVRVAVVALVAVMASISLAAAEPADGEQTRSHTTVRATVDDANISIRYPKSWVAIPLTQDAFDSMKRRYVDTDPRYRWIFRPASIFRTTLMFRASDIKAQIVDGQQSFLTVQVFPASSTLKTFAAEHSKPSIYDTEESTSKVEVIEQTAYRTDLRQEVGPSDTHLNPACHPLPSGGIRCPRWNNHVARLFFRRGSKLVFIAMGCLDDLPCRTLIDDTFASVRPTH